MAVARGLIISSARTLLRLTVAERIREMGLRSPEGAAQRAAAAGPAAQLAARRPVMLTAAVVALAVETAGLCVAGVLTAADAAAGRSYQASSGIALTIFEFVVVAGLALIASGVARLRPWSRTPAVMTQVLTGVVAVYLLQAHRYDWGIPALLVAGAGLAGLLAPVSFRALSRRS
jgi:hypothetical protein